MSDQFDFDLLDDVMNLSSNEFSPLIKQSEICNISSVVEFAYYNYSSFNSCAEYLPKHYIADQFISAYNTSNLVDSRTMLSSSTTNVEFIRTPQIKAEFESGKWNSFLIRAQRAAENSGMEKRFAQAITGTLEEMVENIFWHSQKTETGIAGYRWSPLLFEYVVADSGIGVLNSLKQCDDYSYLQNAGEAIVTALQKGETRFGKASNRGTGFNRLVLNIAKKSSFLRFHSSDYSVTFDGIESYENNSAPDAKIRNCPYLPGFIISVFCKTPNN